MKKNNILTGVGAVITGALVAPQIYYKFRRKNTVDKFAKAHKSKKIYTVSDSLSVNKFQNDITLTNVDGFDVQTSIYEPNEIKAVVHIVHGSLEHRGRYKEFIEFLNSMGYAVIMSDYRGHGYSTSDAYPPGYMDGIDEIIEDLYMVTRHANYLYPGKQIFMLGHSLGSMLARIYLQKYDSSIDKLVLVGTVPPNKISGFGIFLYRLLNFYGDEHSYSKLFSVLPRKKDWISYNTDNLENIKSDSSRPDVFQNAGNLSLIEALHELNNTKKYQVNNKNLPIISLTGADDIVAKGKKGVEKSVDTLKNLGYANVNYKIYPNMKHEILNETDKNIVFNDIISFFEK